MEFLERDENIRYFEVLYNPDLTEGRGYFKKVYVAIEVYSNHKLYLMWYADQFLGKTIALVQGCAPVSNYILKGSTKAEWDYPFANGKAYTPEVYKKVFISNRGNLEGFPKLTKLKGMEFVKLVGD